MYTCIYAYMYICIQLPCGPSPPPCLLRSLCLHVNRSSRKLRNAGGRRESAIARDTETRTRHTKTRTRIMKTRTRDMKTRTRHTKTRTRDMKTRNRITKTRTRLMYDDHIRLADARVFVYQTDTLKVWLCTSAVFSRS